MPYDLNPALLNTAFCSSLFNFRKSVVNSDEKSTGLDGIPDSCY